jgi:anti-sigma regulatory factor (Ser/Thr protein kinase)
MTVLLAERPAWPLSSAMPPAGALPTAAGMARAHVRSVLASWRVDSDTIATFELIVSELVANAVSASTGEDGRPLYGPGGMLVVEVRLYSDGTRLLAEVWDQAVGSPVIRQATNLDESGRGLLMIRALGAEWGWWPDGDRKCVWAEMRSSQPPQRMALAE